MSRRVAASTPLPDVATVQVTSVAGSALVQDPFAYPGHEILGATGAVPARRIVVQDDQDPADKPFSSVVNART